MQNPPLRYEVLPELPRLAWCARVERGGRVLVRCGPWVETGEGGFYEGAWDGDLAEAGWSRAGALFGSGGEAVPGGLLFATPSHNLERLQMLRLHQQGGAVLISNSLAFLLAEAGDGLDPGYVHYEADLMSFHLGVRRCRTSIPTRDGNTVHLFYRANVQVGSDLAVRKLPKPAHPPFRSYQEYMGFLRDEVAALHRNATAAGRQVAYRPLTTISSGYDSPAASLFACEVGCREAVTFASARQTFASTDDSGREIAALLGLQVRELDRTAYRRLGGLPEAEFLAVGNGGEEVVFAALEPLLPGRLLFTGYLGDGAWNRNARIVGPDYRMLYPNGGSFTEFRLRVGFVHLPVPLLGFEAQPSLHALSNSPELAPWSTGDDYDRPLPRRMLEERGVPGHLFGRTKMAVTQPFYHNEPLADVLSETSLADFRAFAAGRTFFRRRRERAAFALRRGLFEANRRVAWRVDPLLARLGTRRRWPELVSERYRQPLADNVWTFHWGMERTLPRYRRGQAAQRVAS